MQKKNPFATLIAYPFTWLVVFCIIICNAAYFAWFKPAPVYLLVLLGIDIVGFMTWFVLALKSSSFRKKFNEMPYEKQNKEIIRTLSGCPDSFKIPAMQCMTLIDQVNREFKNQDYQTELSLLVANIYSLTQDHKKLYNRFQTFGTPDQKRQMKVLIDQQVDSMRKIHDTLQTFSGNLTILAASAEKTAEATNELKYINEGLKEVIQSGY